MNFWLRRSGYVIALALACLYAGLLLWGPQGIPSLLAKQREIRALEEQNAAAQEEIKRRQDRIRKLKESPAYQGIEIRKQLKKQLPGETQFILPHAEQAPADPTGEAKPSQAEPQR